jgi:hypothetical protein
MQMFAGVAQVRRVACIFRFFYKSHDPGMTNVVVNLRVGPPTQTSV